MQDYYEGAPGLAPFYAGSPWDPRLYGRVLERVDARFGDAGRAALERLVRAPTPAAARRLRRVVAEGGVLVTTGQQPGLFGGPLYTVYKILTALRLAAALEPVLERPVSAAFWIASDDHDWAEASRTHVLDPANRLHEVRVAADPDAPEASLGRRRLGDGVVDALDRLGELLPETEFSAGTLEALRAAYRPDRTVAAAFGEIVERLFGERGLLIVDAAEPALKAAAAPLIRRELEEAAEHEALLARQTDRLEAEGYHAQVPILPNAANVFYEDDRGRDRLLREDGGWVLRGSGRRFSAGELLAELDAAPERFSPNVLLRPVLESALLPTVAYVGGPAEISYLAQASCLFRAHGLDAPAVFPRTSVTIVEAKVAKVLDKFGLEVPDFGSPVHELAGRVFRQELPDAVTDAIGALRRSLDDGYGRLLEAAKPIDPTLKGPVGAARSAGQAQLAEAEKKIVQALKRRHSVAMEQLEKAAVNLFPGGRPQERVFCPIPYLVRYGSELVDRIDDAVPIRLDAAAPAWAGVDCG